MSGLEELGIPGPASVREALSSDETFAAIEQFQNVNEILLPSLAPALPLLDLHGILRLDFHQSVMEELREKMLNRIREISAGTDKNKVRVLSELLAKCFPVIRIKALRPVVMCLMQHLPKIKVEYLSVVIKDRELYKEASVEVRQQIWEGNQPLFGDEVSPLLSRFIDLKEAALYNLDSRTPVFFLCTPKNRRQSEVIVDLTKMIGRNVRLYDMVLQFLRTLFLRTRNVHYCTLRAELLMALHDGEINEILSVDPCHKFTWCLDACIREKFVDSKRARELHGFLDSMRWNQEQVLGDLSMILCDPQSIHTMTTSILKALQMSINSDALPRANEDLLLLLRMLSMGLRAWQMIDSQVFKEPKLETHLVTRFLPCIAGLMVDDQIALMPSKAVEQLDPVPEYIISASRDDSIAAMLVVHYALSVARQGLVASVMRILPTLSQCDADTVYSDMTLHEMVPYLASMPDSFTNPDFCVAVFDKFFLPFISRENVVRHLLRLLLWVHQKVNSVTLESIMRMIVPVNQHNNTIKSLYQSVMDKIVSHQQEVQLQLQQRPATPDSAGTLESPLSSVPTPTTPI